MEKVLGVLSVIPDFLIYKVERLMCEVEFWEVFWVRC